MTRIIESSDVNNIINLYLSGKGLREISKIVRHKPETIKRVLIENGITLRVPANARKNLDSDLIAQLYESGESANALAVRFGVSRSAINRCLRESGIVVRGSSEANKLTASKRSPEEKRLYAQSAHDAVRGKSQSEETLCKRAKGVQRNFRTFASPYEADIAEHLTLRGVEFVPQLAVGRYNLDFGISDHIALEVFGGGWHAGGRHALRFSKRSKYLFDRGYTIVICWITLKERFDPSAVADYIVRLRDVLRSDPTTRCKHYVIGANGEPSAIGQSKLDYFT